MQVLKYVVARLEHALSCALVRLAPRLIVCCVLLVRRSWGMGRFSSCVC